MAGDDESFRDVIEAWEAAVTDFKRRCSSADPPTISDIVACALEFPARQHQDVVANLIVVHLDESWKRGRPAYLEDYVGVLGSHFPDYLDLQSLPADIVACEFLARHRPGDAADHPTPEECERRFSRRSDVCDQIREHCFGDGRYVRIAIQPGGHLGRVWLAYDCHLERYVAIKQPNPERGDDAVVARLKREARITARLSHPAVVPVHELLDVDSYEPYYVMRFVEGRTLRELICEYHRRPRANEVDRRKLLESFIVVCDAVAYAHRQGVIHRDLKPDNFRVGEYGETVVLDWGLAVDRASDRLPENGRSRREILSEERENRADTTLGGTPQYMAREQAEGNSGTESDIFALGAVLFEILTARPPYDTSSGEDTRAMLERVRAAEFPAPGSIKRVPGPLESICLKAMSAKIEDRYSSALEIAQDVRRWLADQRVMCHQDTVLEYLSRVVRHHMTVSVVVIAIVLTLTVAGVAIQQYRIARLEQRRRLVERATRAIESTRTSSRVAGWRREALGRARDHVANAGGEDLRDQVVSVLSGVDASLAVTLKFPAEGIAFSRDGSKVLFSGSRSASRKGADATPAHLLNSSNETAAMNVRGAGVVAFDADENPVQLKWTGGSLELRNAATNALIRTLRLRESSGEKPLALAISHRADFFAASFKRSNSRPRLIVLKAENRTPIIDIGRAATAIAFSPDGRLVAIGDDDGRVQVWTLPDGKEVRRLQRDRMSIASLSFGRDYHQSGELGFEWVLAAGEAGGMTTIWDLDKGRARSHCRGHSYEVLASAFSSDGATLATVGRIHSRLWDVATGRHLLSLPSRPWARAVKFTPDSQRLVLAGIASNTGEPGFVEMWDLEMDAGIKELRGLPDKTEKLAMSSDGRLLAALGHDWKVGIWDTASGSLQHVLSVPQGTFADNSAMAFDKDGVRFAFAAGEKATLWDLRSGSRVRAWSLNKGLQDQLSFQGPQTLMHFRVENKPLESGGHFPVCRGRNLLSRDPMDVVYEIETFDRQVHLTGSTIDGRVVVVDGVCQDEGEARRTLAGIDIATGNIIWREPFDGKHGNASLSVDSLGGVFSSSYDGDLQTAYLRDIKKGRKLRRHRPGQAAFGDNGRYRAYSDGNSFALEDLDSRRVLFRVYTRSSAGSLRDLFSPAGQAVAWGSQDGTVYWCRYGRVLALLRELRPAQR